MSSRRVWPVRGESSNRLSWYISIIVFWSLVELAVADARRNAVRLAREAEENARGTIAKLADQSGKLTSPLGSTQLTLHLRAYREH